MILLFLDILTIAAFAGDAPDPDDLPPVPHEELPKKKYVTSVVSVLCVPCLHRGSDSYENRSAVTNTVPLAVIFFPKVLNQFWSKF